MPTSPAATPAPSAGGPGPAGADRSYRRPFYGWTIVGAGTLNASLLVGLVFYGFGVFMEPLTQELGWSATAVAFGFSLQRMEAGLFAPVAGYLIDRFGARRVGFIGTAIYGAAFLVFASVETLWDFYLASLLIALGQSLGTLANFTATLMRWFRRLRARAVSFTVAGTSLGTAAVYPLVAAVEHFGWRGTLIGMSVVIWVVGFATMATLRPDPERYGLRPDGDPPDSLPGPGEVASAAPAQNPAAATAGVGASAAMRSSSFWFLLLANLMCSFSNLGWVVLQFPALEAKGFSTSLASGAVGAYGIVSIGARIGLGWFGDRFGRARLFTASFLLMGLGLAVFAAAQSFAALLPYYLLYGLGHAAFVITSQTVVADYFGTHRFATIRGWLGTSSAIGSAAGPLVGAWLFDQSGSYDGAFALFAVVVVLGAPAALLADRRKPPQSPAQATPPTTHDTIGDA